MRDKRRTAIPVSLAVLVIAVVFGAVTFSKPDERRAGPQLDPESTTVSGARAALTLLDDVGVDASGGDLPRPGEVGTLVILVDDLDDDGWSAVRRFVERGGDLVVAVPFAPLAAAVDGTVSGPGSLRGPCEIPELAAVRQVAAPVVRTFEGSGCLSLEGSPIAVAGRIGDGRVLSLGTAHPWRNDAIAEADNAAFVVGAGRWGTPPVRVLVRAPVGTGSETLVDLVPNWVWAGFAQLGLAFVAYALWRAIRLGAPVREADVVEHTADFLVTAEAALTSRSGDDHHALRAVMARWRAEVNAVTGEDGSDARAIAVRPALPDDQADLVVRSLQEAGADALGHARLVSEAREALRGGPEAPRDENDMTRSFRDATGDEVLA